MVTEADKQLPNEPVEILKNLGSIVEQLQPELLKTLGGIATIGAGQPEDVWVEELSNAADGIGRRLGVIYEAINSIPVAAPPAESAADHTSAKVIVPTKVPDSSVSQGATPEASPDILSGLSITPNERAALDLVMAHLRQVPGNQNSRNLLQVAFGKSRLAKVEEDRFRQILEACCQLGVLKKYGKSYNLDEQSADQLSPPLSQDEIDILDYLADNIDQAPDGVINIGQIIRKHIGIQVLERTAHLALIDQLNSLAARGYLTHAKNSPWYGLGERRARAELGQSGLPITTPALGFNPEKAVAVTKSDKADATEPPAVESKPLKEITELSDLATDILSYCTNGIFFRIEELRRDIAKLSTMTDDEYKKFKTDFGKIRQNIIDYLESQNIVARWEEDGRNRGKKYRLIQNGQTGIADATTPTVGKKVRRLHRRSPKAATSLPTHQIVNEDTTSTTVWERPLTNAERRRQIRRASHFTLKLVEGVGDLLEAQPNGKEKLSVISKLVASGLGITRAAARELVRELIEQGHFYKNGSVKGMTLVSKEKPKVTTQEPNSSEVEKARKRKEEFKALREEDITTVNRVYDQLLTLKHVQQGLEVRQLLAALEIGKQDEESFRRSLRRLEGKGFIFIRRNANPNTRSDHSKKIYASVVQFPSQEFKDRVKGDRAGVITEIRSMIEAAASAAAQ